MNLEVMKASEARSISKDYAFKVTDEHYAHMVREINKRIGHAAEVGEFECKVRVDDLFSVVGLKNLSDYYRKGHTLTIINSLCYAGYAVELVPNYKDKYFLSIDISW